MRVYVECMEGRGYRPQIVGAGGVPMTVDQLPEPPRGLACPAPLPAPTPVAQVPGCESQAAMCQRCQNGRYRGTGFFCQYDSLSQCRASILSFCKQNPSSDKALVVKGGKLTNDQAYELMMSCPNIPHGAIPYSGSPPAPGSKKWRQCQAFEKTYVACSLLIPAGPQRGDCFRKTYDGP